MVPGIGFSPDRFLQGRLFSYGDAQRYRLGVNYNHVPVNRAKVEVNEYHRDGAMRADGNYGGDLWRVMTEYKKQILIENTAGDMASVTENIKYRHAVHCYLADPEYGERFTEAAGLCMDKVKELSFDSGNAFEHNAVKSRLSRSVPL